MSTDICFLASPVASPLTASSYESSSSSVESSSDESLQMSLLSQIGMNTVKLVDDNIDKDLHA